MSYGGPFDVIGYINTDECKCPGCQKGRELHPIQATSDEPLAPVDDDTNPKDRLGVKKVPLSLVPMVGIIWEALAFAEGARKYGEFNWRRKQVRRRVYLEAILRHTLAALAGEDLDPDSQLPHEAKIRACCGIILDAKECGALIDDRYEKDHTANLINRLTAGDYKDAAAKLTRTPARTLGEISVNSESKDSL